MEYKGERGLLLHLQVTQTCKTATGNLMGTLGGVSLSDGHVISILGGMGAPTNSIFEAGSAATVLVAWDVVCQGHDTPLDIDAIRLAGGPGLLIPIRIPKACEGHLFTGALMYER